MIIFVYSFALHDLITCLRCSFN